MAYITNPRQETTVDEKSQAHDDAILLYNAGEGRLGTDEAAIIQIFSTRTARQLNAAFHSYQERYSQDIETVGIIHYSFIVFLVRVFKVLAPFRLINPEIIRVLGCLFVQTSITKQAKLGNLPRIVNEHLCL